MGNFGKREQEINEEYTELGPKMTEQEAKAFKEMIPRYFEAREKGLNDLLAVVQKEDQSAINQEAEWKSKAEEIKRNLNDMLANVLSSNNLRELTDPARIFHGVMLKEETSFFEGLTTVGVAAKRDELVQKHTLLDKEIVQLASKWATYRSDNQYLEASEQAIAEETIKIMSGVCDEVAMKRKSLLEKVTNTGHIAYQIYDKAKISASVDSWLSHGNEVMQTVGMIIKALEFFGGCFVEVNKRWVSMNPRYISRMQEYYNLMVSRQMGGVFSAFLLTRKDVDEFLKNNSLEKIKKLSEEGRDAIGRWASSVPTPGQKDDAKTFADFATTALQKRYTDAEIEMNCYMQQNASLFIGPLASQYKEELMQLDKWRNYYREFEGIDLESQMKGLREMAKGMVSNEFIQIIENVQRWADAIPADAPNLKELKDAAKRGVDEIKKKIEQEVKPHMNEFMAYCEQLPPKEAEKVFKRKELEAKLSS